MTVQKLSLPIPTQPHCPSPQTYLAWKHNALITDYKHILEEKDCYGKFAWRNERLSLWISYRLYYLLMTKSFCFLVVTQASLWPLFLPAWGGHPWTSYKTEDQPRWNRCNRWQVPTATWPGDKAFAMDSITHQQNNATGKQFYSAGNHFPN